MSDDDDGLVLRDDSLDALEMSGHEMWRLFRFRPDKKDPEYFSGAGSGIGTGSFAAVPELEVLLFLCHIQGHLLDEKFDLKLFLLRRLLAKPLTDCWKESDCCKVPNGAISLRSMADEPRMMAGADDGESEAVDFCRKCRRIRGSAAGDEEADDSGLDVGGEWGRGVGGTDPDL